MSSFELSTYQKDILNFIENKTGNLLVDAKAGSGKTSTLVLLADKIIEQNNKCLFLAFNKSIIEELQSRIISDNCQIKTLHSLGLSFIRSYLYRKYKENYVLDIDQKDIRIKDRVEELFEKKCLASFLSSPNVEQLDDNDVKDTLSNIQREIANMINFCRLYNINYKDSYAVCRLGTELCYHLKEYVDYGLYKYPEIVETIIDEIKYNFENPIMNEENKPVYVIGYTDMIYLPCLYNMFPPFSIKQYLNYVLCDECQDLSVLQQKFLRLLDTNNTRYIFVGDEKQAIYGFAGADTKSIRNLKNNFNLTELPLNICYRCPKNIIKLAQTILSTIDWNHNRTDEGEVKFINESDLKNKIKPSDVILGRRNKDLVKIYKQLVIDEKIPVKFKNLEMVSTIVTDITRSVKEYIKRYNQYSNVERKLYEVCDLEGINWKKDEKDLSDKDKKFINTKYKQLVKDNKLANKKNICKTKYSIKYLKTCMLEYKEEGDYKFAKSGSMDALYSEYFDIILDLLNEYQNKTTDISVTEFLNFVENFLKGDINKDVPILSSIHMMKGGEADNVFILDYPRFPYTYNNQTDDAKQQEVNLQYVALTRPKKNLYLCYIRTPKPRETEEDIIELNNRCESEVYRTIHDRE